MKVQMELGKVKTFGIDWCIPHRIVTDNAEGEGGQAGGNRRLKKIKLIKINAKSANDGSSNPLIE